jgi:hypothetical protein
VLVVVLACSTSTAMSPPGGESARTTRCRPNYFHERGAS